MTDRPRPRAFRLDTAPAPRQPTEPAASLSIIEEPDAYAREIDPAAPTGEAAIEDAQRSGVAPRRGLTWGGLFWAALGGLVSLGLSLWATQLVEDLFARAPALGWVGAALAALAVLALAVLAAREIVGVARQRRIARLHMALAAARAADDATLARPLLRELTALYAARPGAARGRAQVEAAMEEIVDGRDLIDIAERGLMAPLDAQCARAIATAAKRVSVFTAISPRALLDVLFAGAQAVRLIRLIAEIYGGRPGFFGFLRLARSVGAHLAITGGMAVGDSLLQQVLGHGVAARISARLGEGVLNGLLTARVGLSAMAVCRPMPYAIGKPPGVKEVAPFLFDKPLAKSAND